MAIQIERVQTTRRVRTVPGSTLRGGLRPWLQDFSVEEYQSETSNMRWIESGFGHPFRPLLASDIAAEEHMCSSWEV